MWRNLKVFLREPTRAAPKFHAVCSPYGTRRRWGVPAARSEHQRSFPRSGFATSSERPSFLLLLPARVPLAVSRHTAARLCSLLLKSAHDYTLLWTVSVGLGQEGAWSASFAKGLQAFLRPREGGEALHLAEGDRTHKHIHIHTLQMLISTDRPANRAFLSLPTLSPPGAELGKTSHQHSTSFVYECVRCSPQASQSAHS